MKYLIASLMVLACTALAFGPDIPDVPDADIPDIEIPGLDILDGVQVQLDELVTATDSLAWLLPELSALEDVAAKLEEIRETDPDIIGLQERVESLRTELLIAKSEIEEVSDLINGEIEEVRSSIDSFMDGLPIPD